MWGLEALLPPGISLLVVGILLVVSFIASGLTAAMGVGGGMLMLVALTYVLPAAVMVPVHGVIQLGSNTGRAWVQRAHILWPLVLWFGLGAIAGSLAGGMVALSLPDHLFKAAIGLFIILTIWLPMPRVNRSSKRANVVAGVFTSFLSMLFGATGPLVAVWVAGLPSRHQVVGNHAMLMVTQHLFKVLVFGGLGFAYAGWVPFIAAIIVAGFLGTLVGSRLLVKMPESAFRIGFRIMLTVLALDLVRRAVWP